MSKRQPVIAKKVSLSGYVMILRGYMYLTECKHISGFVNTSALSAPPDEQEKKKLVDSAVRAGLLSVQKGEMVINPVVFTFMNAWAHGIDIVMLKKAPYSPDTGIAFARAGGMYLAMIQNASKDEVVLAADADPHILYDFLRKDIERKAKGINFQKKEANRIFKEQNRDIVLQIEPANQIFLQCIRQTSGENEGVNRLLNIGKKQGECLCFDKQNNISDVQIFETAALEEQIVGYIEEHCTEGEEPAGRANVTDDTGMKDAEPYTKMSFQNITSREDFPKGAAAFFKMMLRNFLKGFLNWKSIIKKIIFFLLMPMLVLVWNIFALCYLNDTFHIDNNAIFGHATAYLLAGVADTGRVAGLPPFTKTVNTVIFTAPLFFLLSIAVCSLIGDIKNKRIASNLRGIFTLRSSIRDYLSVAPYTIDHYIWMGLAVAAVLNILLFNPFTVALTAVMLLFSCAKGEAGGLPVFLMLASSSFNYKKVMLGKKKLPLFGVWQLRLFGLGSGLLLCTGLNIILWYTVGFHFWVRLLLCVFIAFFALVRSGIIQIRVSKTSLFVVCFIITQIVAVLSVGSILALADDGGWSESGRSLLGLFNNSGWPEILGFSAVLAVAAAMAAVSFGLSAAAVGSLVFAASVAFSTTSYGKKVAFDFLYGGYSPYGGNSKLAAVLGALVSLSPIGPYFDGVMWVRDCSYDIKEGDSVALLIDMLGACEVFGLSSEGDTSDYMKGVVSALLPEEWNSVYKMVDRAGSIGDLDNMSMADMASTLHDGLNLTKGIIDRGKSGTSGGSYDFNLSAPKGENGWGSNVAGSSSARTSQGGHAADHASAVKSGTHRSVRSGGNKTSANKNVSASEVDAGTKGTGANASKVKEGNSADSNQILDSKRKEEVDMSDTDAGGEIKDIDEIKEGAEDTTDIKESVEEGTEDMGDTEKKSR